MDVSVSICTWNRSASLRTTLSSLTALRIPEGLSWELLIVDNNCTDDTDDVALGFRSSLPVRLLHEPRAGLSFARNRAIQEAGGRLLLWTDDDVIVDPEWLAAMVDAFDRYDASWVFGRSEPAWPGEPPRWYAPRLRGNFAVLDYGPESFIVRDKHQPFFGLNFGGTRDAHLALSGFRSEFGVRERGGGIGEDLDLFQRALQAGMRIVYTPHALVHHAVAPERLRKAYHRRRQWAANEVYYTHLREIFPEVPWLLGLPRFFFAQAASESVAYIRAGITGDRGNAFYYELRLVRFLRLLLEAARRGFRGRGTGAPR